MLNAAQLLRERFPGKVEASDSGCLLWSGAKLRSGYGVIKVGGRAGKNVTVHRIAYIAAKGEVPEGLVIDHLCRMRHCVNPDHLEAVTHRENCLRGTGSPAQNFKKKICKNGHELTEGNTYIQTTYKFPRRSCRTCRRASQAAYELRKRQSKYQDQRGPTRAAA